MEDKCHKINVRYYFWLPNSKLVKMWLHQRFLEGFLPVAACLYNRWIQASKTNLHSQNRILRIFVWLGWAILSAGRNCASPGNAYYEILEMEQVGDYL